MIPYTTERRADTGVTNVTMGMWLFLASEVMLFGALFSAYALLRVSATSWPHGRDVLDVDAALTNTVVLVAASFFVWRARQVQGHDHGAARRLLQGAILALVFGGLKAREYQVDFAKGLAPSTSTFLAMYFTLTGLHALHVVGGAIANTWVAASARRAGEALTAGRVHALSLYWTFVDLVWVAILWLVYF